MPELPDVQVFCELLEEEGLHRTVETVSLRPDGMTATVSDSTLRDALKGHRLTEARRHGKHLFARSGEERSRWLRLHFGMTGALHVYDSSEGEPDHTRLRLDFRGGRSLAYRCPRKFGEIGLVESPDAFVEEQGLGPDPFREGFGLEEFRQRIEERRGSIKGTLMNQEVMAGLGNVYVDEILFQADMHPETPVDTLSGDQVRKLWRATETVMRKAVECRAERDRMPSSWLLPRREEGADCPRCEGTLVKAEVNGRATYLCDRHQTKG